MAAREDVYQKLRDEISKMPIPMPPAESGVELNLLRHLFTPEEAAIALNLNILPENLGRIHRRVAKSGIAITREELESVLDHLVDVGAILGGGLFEAKGKGKLYSLSQMVVGMFEFQVDRLTPAYVRDFNQYMDERFHMALLPGKTAQMRTIPVSTAVTPEMHIARYEDIKAYVRGLKDDIAVANCVCRQSTEVSGGKCGHSDIMETCLMFKDAARFALGRKKGRRLDNAGALEILDRAEKAGFILQPENARNPQFVCCCCTDCCHAIKVLKRHPRPSELLISNYRAVIDPVKCKGCKKCLDRCAMGAISLMDKTAVVDPDRCIGCGVCVASCANGAHRLIPKEKRYVPPRTHDAMYQKILMERLGVMKTLKAVSRVVTGRKA